MQYSPKDIYCIPAICHFILDMAKIKYCHVHGERIDYLINRADTTNHVKEIKVKPPSHYIKTI